METESDLGKQGRSAKHIAEADQVPGKWEQFTSQMSVDTHLSNQEVNTNAVVKNEAAKEKLTDTNRKAIERIKNWFK